jgi:hypothetical protein
MWSSPHRLLCTPFLPNTTVRPLQISVHEDEVVADKSKQSKCLNENAKPTITTMI